MREIKFRAWDKDNFEMFTYDNIGDVIFGLENNGTVSLFICDSEESPNVEIMQFTGLTDKNGVDIYEGDIVCFTYWWFDGNECESNLTGEIVWAEGNMSFQLKGVKNKDWERFTGYENNSDYLTPFSELNFEEADFEVIGNIHQNPELTALKNQPTEE